MQIYHTVDRAAWVHASCLDHRGRLLAVAIHPRDMTSLYHYAHSKIELCGLLTKRVPTEYPELPGRRNPTTIETVAGPVRVHACRDVPVGHIVGFVADRWLGVEALPEVRR
jgi:hypothetical protein